VVDEGFSEPLLRWIPALPLLAAAVHLVALGVVRRPLPRGAVLAISCGAPVGALGCAAAAFANLIALAGTGGVLSDAVQTWIGAGIGRSSFSADLSFRLDALSAVMLLLVTVVGLAIHVHAARHADVEERAVPRLFALLNLLLGSMLVLVLADNLLLLLLGWQGVALASHLLIGFRYADAEAADAGVVAFVTNRMGDVGFFVGILLLFWSLSDAGVPTISFRGMEVAFAEVAQRTLEVPGAPGRTVRLADVIGLCFLLAACGKGAQLPLHLWLRGSVAAPSPAAALIHSAATVTAGVYVMCRLSFVYASAPVASGCAAWIGALSAVLAATAAVTQRDIYRTLAWSTMSHVGVMFLAVGSGAFASAVFHVVTHAFPKALLLLGAGSVVLGLRGERDLRRMGALRKRLPKTRVVMLVGALALTGAPGLSTFFSTDEILVAVYASALPGHRVLYWLGCFTLLLTSFYVVRLYLRVFEGESHVVREIRAHLQESDDLALGPLYVLAVLSVVGGFMVGLPQFWGDMIGIADSDSLGKFVRTVVASNAAPGTRGVKVSTEWGLVLSTVAAWALGAAAAWGLERRPALAQRAGGPLASLGRLLRRGWDLPDLYRRGLVQPLLGLSDRVLARGIDAGLIDGLVLGGAARSVRALANDVLRWPQSGLVPGYLVVTVLGTVGVLLYLVG
jgi:NADH-quinone oxidoreductase subunit L